MSERIVVVGGGLAGLRCAERLRELRFDGELVIVGSEPDLPYHRPALSKQLLTGATDPAEMTLARLDEIDAEWRFTTPATHLQPGRQVVHLPGAEELPYDGLVIASGVEPRRLSGVPHGHPRVVVVRTLADAAGLRDNLAADHGPVAVLGSGFIGCEVAASLREVGREVTIIGRSASLLGEVVGKHIGQKLSALHRARGVRLALGASIDDWQTTANGLRLHSSDGWILDVSCVIVAVGTVPSISWLRGARLPLDDGVVCSPTCHVLGTSNIVAAGDVAQWPNLRFDETPRRVEHWLNAVEMGRAAAENLLAGPQASRPFAPVPRFWSEQHGVRIQAGGIPKLGTDTVALASPVGGEKPVTGFVRKGRLVVLAALVVGAAMWWQAADPDGQAALTAGAPVTEALPGPRVPPPGTTRPSTPADSPPGTRLTAVHMTKMGQAILDETGAVLFRYERDNPHKARSACLGDCAAVWTPITTSGTPSVTGIDPALVGTVKRPEGAKQVTLAGWPLYKFANARPGEWTGQGTDHVWFVIRPDGQRNLNCLPTPVQ